MNIIPKSNAKGLIAAALIGAVILGSLLPLVNLIYDLSLHGYLSRYWGDQIGNLGYILVIPAAEISQLCFGTAYNWCAFVINPIIGVVVGVLVYMFFHSGRKEGNGTIKLGLISLLFGFAYFTSAHPVVVHEQITKNAVAAASANSPGYNLFLGAVSHDCSAGTALQWMARGSRHEDDADMDAGGKRSYNHFYDPLQHDFIYGKGLSDFPPDIPNLMGTNSLVWASISNCLGLNVKPFGISKAENLNTSNIWTWQNARGYEWYGLTIAEPSLRTSWLEDMFRALGQTMHLLEDCSQPQHVRNEQHLDVPLPVLGTPWISPIETYEFNNWNTLNYGDGSMLDWYDLGFLKMESFWDRHLYAMNANTGNSGALNSDASPGGTQLGLAEFCNANFLGDRHQYAEFYPSSSLCYYPYPSLLTGTDYKLIRGNPGLAVSAGPRIAGGKKVYQMYLAKTGDGVTMSHHCLVRFLGAKFPDDLPAARKALTAFTSIRDANVLNDYQNIFIPKAIRYSAGLLDYYFRGRIAVGVSGASIILRNTSAQNFYGGSFTLYEDDSLGNRTQVGSAIPLYGSLASLGSTTLTPAQSLDANNNYTLVYQGTIGSDAEGNPTDPVDAGIGIAATSFTPSTAPIPDNSCGGLTDTLTSRLDWHYPGWAEIFAISSPYGEITHSGNTVSFMGGLQAETTYFQNSGDCPATITVQADFGSNGDFWIGTGGSVGTGGNDNLNYFYPSWTMTGAPYGSQFHPKFYVTIPPHSNTQVTFIINGLGGNLTFYY